MMVTRPRHLFALHIAALSLLMVAPPTHAVGTVIIDDTPQVITSGQALMSWSDDDVTLDVRLVLPPGPGGIWLLPLPAGASAEITGEEVLDTLADWDAPTITVSSATGDDAACGSGPDPTTLITAQGSRELPDEVGAFDEVGVLKTPSLSSLEDWLEEQDQSLPASLESGLDQALPGDRDLVWAAVAPAESERLTPTLRVRFHQLPDAKQPLPLGLVGAEDQGRYDLLLHVLADRRYRVENYPSVAISRLGERLVEHGESSSPYVNAMDAVADEAGGSLVITESAGAIASNGPLSELISGDETFLTRLHLRAAPEGLVDAMIAFAKDGPPQSPEVHVDVTPDATAALPLLLLLALGISTRGRRPPQR